MVPRAVCVDSGGHFTSSVYEFCHARFRRRVWAIKGRGGPGVPIWPKKPTRTKGGCPVFLIGVDQIKHQIYARLKNDRAGTPGYMGFDASLPDGWFDQLTAERLVVTYKRGFAVSTWILPSGIRNEALDCCAYALAALHGFYAIGFDLAREAQILENVPLRVPSEPGSPPAPMPPSVNPPPVRRRTIRSSWLAAS